MKRRAFRRGLMIAGGVVALSIALVGVAHTRLGRPLLARMSGCPVAGRTATPQQLEDFRVKNAQALKGASRAAARPASGFVLDRSTRDEVLAWGQGMHATCNEELGGAAVRCEHAAEIEDAFFRFDPRGALVGVDLVHTVMDGGTAVRVVDDLASKIEREAGKPSAVRGTHSAEFLQGQFRQVSTEFRFADYAADVTATNLGQGIVVREQYRSIPD